jgi:hypothetical protein
MSCQVRCFKLTDILTFGTVIEECLDLQETLEGVGGQNPGIGRAPP